MGLHKLQKLLQTIEERRKPNDIENFEILEQLQAVNLEEFYLNGQAPYHKDYNITFISSLLMKTLQNRAENSASWGYPWLWQAALLRPYSSQECCKSCKF